MTDDLISRAAAIAAARVFDGPVSDSDFVMGQATAAQQIAAALASLPAAQVEAGALETLRRQILQALSDAEEGMCLSLHGLSSRTGLPRETLRGIIADMRADGLVSYHKGLWREDGTPGGAGYAIAMGACGNGFCAVCAQPDGHPHMMDCPHG